MIQVRLGSKTYNIPETGDLNWSDQLTDYLVDLGTEFLKRNSGTFALLSPLNFGGAHGITVKDLKVGTDTDSINYTDSTLKHGTKALVDEIAAGNGISVSTDKNKTTVSVSNIPLSEIVDPDRTSGVAVWGNNGVLGRDITSLDDLSMIYGLENQVNPNESDNYNLFSYLAATYAKLTGSTLTNAKTSTTPTVANHLANKQYVDEAVASAGTHHAVDYAFSNVNVGAFNNDLSSLRAGQTFHGVTLQANDIVLLKINTPVYDGVYKITNNNLSLGSDRPSEYNTTAELNNVRFYVKGTSNDYNGGSTIATKATGSTPGQTGFSMTFSVVTDSSIHTDGEGLDVTGNEISLELDGTTLSKSASGLKVNKIDSSNIGLAGISPGHIRGLSASTVAVASGNGVLISSQVPVTALNNLLGSTGNLQNQINQISSNTTFARATSLFANTPNINLTQSYRSKVILVNSPNSSPTVSLPSAATFGKFDIVIKDISGKADTYNITITPNGSDTIEGVSASLPLRTGYGRIHLVCDGTSGWWVI